MCKKDDRSLHQNSVTVPHFYWKQKTRFIFRHLDLKKGLKRFIKEHIPDVRTIIS